VSDETVGVQVVGLATLTRTMRKAGEDLTDLKTAHAAAGQVVARAAAATAPRLTGRLAGTLRASKAANRARVTAGTRSVPYSMPIHWGWPARRIAANPWVSQAARDTESIWLPDYLKAVEEALSHIEGA
jgi:hypothetical protein